MNQYGQAEGYAGESLSTYTAKTFLWMFAGLLVTFAMAYIGYAAGITMLVFSNPYGIFVITGIELFVVISMSARIH